MHVAGRRNGILFEESHAELKMCIYAKKVLTSKPHIIKPTSTGPSLSCTEDYRVYSTHSAIAEKVFMRHLTSFFLFDSSVLSS